MFEIPPPIFDAIKLDIAVLMRVSKITDTQDAVCIFIFGMLSEDNGVKLLYNSLAHRGVSEKLIHSFLDYCLKMKYKLDRGLWSWFEIEEFDIPIDDVKICTTKYELP